MSDSWWQVIWSGGIPLGIVVTSGFFKGVVAKGVSKKLVAIEHFFLGVELCVAALVECFAVARTLMSTHTTLPSPTVGYLIGSIVVTFIFLLIVTVIHDRNESREDCKSKTAMLLMADAIGFVLMFFVLLQGHKLLLAKGE
jgi:hypothetical protein